MQLPSFDEVVLQSHMGRTEAEFLVEADGLRSLAVAGELDDAATVASGLLDGPADHGLADTPTPEVAGDPYALYLGALAAGVGQTGDVGELKRSHHDAVDLCDDQPVVRVRVDR